MRVIKLLLCVLFFSTAGVNSALSQGCSDAGFCSMSSFQPHSGDSLKQLKNQVKAGLSYGQADHAISVAGIFLEYRRDLSNRMEVTLKLTSLSQNGDEYSGFGLSDVWLSSTYRAGTKIKLTLGAKIPLTNANTKYEGIPLPMDYQSSLGTFDLIAGVGYEIGKLQLVAALQQPLTQNSNQFLAEIYPENSGFRKFQSTNEYQRSGDVLLRISYPFSVGKKVILTPGLLPIYHLGNDQYNDLFNAEREIKGSQGLTLNANLFADFQINSRNTLQLNAGMPLVVRDERPDGLTRSFVVNLEYAVRF